MAKKSFYMWVIFAHSRPTGVGALQRKRAIFEWLNDYSGRDWQERWKEQRRAGFSVRKVRVREV
jgi:hypothetical protein